MDHPTYELTLVIVYGSQRLFLYIYTKYDVNALMHLLHKLSSYTVITHITILFIVYSRSFFYNVKHMNQYFLIYTRHFCISWTEY